MVAFRIWRVRVKKLKVLDLFAGIGGFTVAGEMAGGYETVAFCEIDKNAQKVLARHWPDVPIHEDVTKLTGADVGAIDVITGGFPCQDVSSAGGGLGVIDGKRSSLFREILRLAAETGRPCIVMENVGNLIRGGSGIWFASVMHGLAEIGYDAEWHVLPASYIGAIHRRERIWIIAYPSGFRQCATRGPVFSSEYQKVANWEASGLVGAVQRGEGMPYLCRDHDGVRPKMDASRLRQLGNAIVPQVASCFMKALYEAHFDAQ